MDFRSTLLAIATAYEEAVARLGGRSLPRVATIVVNRGSFFDAVREGSTFSVRNLDKFIEHFRRNRNWPGNLIPDEVRSLLLEVGRPPIEKANFSAPTPATTEAAAAHD